MASAVSYATDAELIAAGAEFRILRDRFVEAGARLSRAMTSPTQWIRSSTGS
jgi:hypothetical protein